MGSNIFLGHTGTEADADLEALLSAIPAGRSLLTSLKQYLANNAVVNVLDEGARSDGSSDDAAVVTTSIAKAIADGRGVVEFPQGYFGVLASKITVPQGITIRGVGKPAGGINNTPNLFSTILKDHTDDCFLFTGQNGVLQGSGGGVERLRIVQMHGSPATTGGLGAAVALVSSSNSNRPSWFHADRVIIEEMFTIAAPWTNAFRFDDGGFSFGPIDLRVTNCDTHVSSVGGATGAFNINGVGGNTQISCCTCSQNSNFVLGDKRWTTAIYMTDIVGASLVLDQAGQIHFRGGVLIDVSITANTGAVGAPVVLVPGFIQDRFFDTHFANAAIMNYDSIMASGASSGSWFFSEAVTVRNARNFQGEKAAANRTCKPLIGIDGSDNVRINVDGSAITVVGAPSVSPPGAANGDLLVSRLGIQGSTDHACSGSPNGQITGNVGDTCRRSDGGAGTSFYVKESGAGTNTGWVGK